MDKFVLIDGNSILNRAFYGIMGTNTLMTSDGVHTNAVYGFLAIMFKIIEDIKPKYIAVAFDLKAPTKRHLKYAEYKATRKGMPNELAEQLPIIKDILYAMNIAVIEKEGYEADDILGTLAKYGEKKGLEVTILTGDRDAFQLASNNITIRIPRTKMGKTEVEDFNKEKIIQTYGVTPAQLIEVKGLMGDKSDNIPGVPGVGEKTALELVKRYRNIDKLYEELYNDDCEIKGKTKEKLLENKDLAYLSRELGIIDVKANIEKNLDLFEVKEWNNDKVLRIFKKLKFNRYIERFDLKESKKEETVINEIIEVELLNNAKDIIKQIEDNKRIFYYIETKDSLNKDLIIQKEIIGIAIYSEKDNKSYYLKNIQELKEIFENKDILKCSYKQKQDYILLKQIGINCENLMYDVEIAGYILNSTSNNYNIEELSKEYLDINPNDIIESTNNTDIQINLFGNAQDVKKLDEFNKKIGIYAYCIYKLYFELTQKLENTNQLELFNNIEMPLVEVLADMQYTGIYVDKIELMKYGEELQNKAEILKKEIYELSGEEFNINSTKQLAEVLFEKLKLPVYKKNKSGYSTDVDVLEKLKNQHPVIEKILEYRQLLKLNSTFVAGMMQFVNEKTHKIHSYFHQTVTSTGRISSTDPNLQNIPTKMEVGKQLRKVFKSEENNIFLDADYSQIELRVLAHISNDENMINAFNNNEDIHAQAASKVFNIPIDQVTKQQRSEAKAVNFGIVYGISDYGLAEQLNISKKQAQSYIDQYLEKYSGIKQFMDNIINITKEKGYVETLFNRRRYIPEINSNNYMVRQFGNRIALNTPIQGTAADIIKIAMVNVYKQLKEKNLKSKLVLQVHDELLIRTSLEEKDIVRDILKNCMENAMKLNVPLKADISEGYNWYEAK